MKDYNEKTRKGANANQGSAILREGAHARGNATCLRWDKETSSRITYGRDIIFVSRPFFPTPPEEDGQ